MMWRSFVLFTVLAFLLAGCGGDDSTSVTDDTVATAVIDLPGAIAPPNPVSGAETPASLNRATAIEYRRDGAEVEQVVLLVPGIFGGAGGFDYLARRVVARSGGRVAVWAIERRSNGLEDATGLEAAKRERDPDLAKNYYFAGADIDGHTFAGFNAVRDPSYRYAAEWGLAVHVEDIDVLVAEARRRFPGAQIFLGGHSLGGSLTGLYGAWNFGERAGFEGVDGLIFLEGLPQTSNPLPPTQADYESRGVAAGLGRSSLQSLRTGDPFAAIPLVGRELYGATEVAAMAVGLPGVQDLHRPTLGHDTAPAPPARIRFAESDPGGGATGADRQARWAAHVEALLRDAHPGSRL